MKLKSSTHPLNKDLQIQPGYFPKIAFNKMPHQQIPAELLMNIGKLSLFARAPLPAQENALADRATFFLLAVLFFVLTWLIQNQTENSLYWFYFGHLVPVKKYITFSGLSLGTLSCWFGSWK